MARPSKQLDLALLREGRTQLERHGCRELSVREVCTAAGVNLGMFHYHFGTKDAFVGRLLEETYGPMFARLGKAAASEGDPVDRLRTILLLFGDWVREHRLLLARLVSDLIAGEPAVVAFVQKAETRHIAVIAGLVVEAQAKGRLGGAYPLEAIAVIGGACFLPLLVGTLALNAGQVPPILRVLLEGSDFFTTEALGRRIDIALRGLAPVPHPPPSR
ncbi:MAG: TetR/AcrR family transcriptional regulator [Verrucomicrobia bacterium]|nr:TetR/AcrR family transcriptional regulator [Verrucomicrobiota bacterium]